MKKVATFCSSFQYSNAILYYSTFHSSEQYIPTLNGTHGSNFFDPDYKMLHVLLRGSTPVQINTASVLFISFNLPAMTEKEFFGDQLVNNLALFLKVPPSMIRITKIVREGGGARRRRSATGLTVEVEIKQPPTNQMSANSTSGEQPPQQLPVGEDKKIGFAHSHCS